MIKDVLTVAKTMKLPNILVTPNIILGTDDNFCMVSSIEIQSEIPRPFSTNIKCLLPTDQYVKQYSIGNLFEQDKLINEFDKLGDDYYINIASESNIEMGIRSLYTNVHWYINNSDCVIENYNAGDCQDFRNILSMKVSDGHAFFMLEPYIMSFYGSLVSANASDKIIINIYKERINTYYQPATILMKCSVIKKKYTIDNYIKYRLL